jgi:H+/Cl- antiporter ClcA
MGLDIKIPIGLMFTILGIILTILGIVTNGDPELYAKSLGHNINLWSGLFMIAFGLFMLLTSTLVRKKKLG